MAAGQFLFEGQIDNNRWQNEVYLSVVDDYRSLDGVFEEQILSKVQTDSTGFFQFHGNQLNRDNRIYKLHVDNCSEFEQGSNHSFGHCEDSRDIVFIAKNTDTISFPLSFEEQMFCEITSTNPKTDALLKIDSLKERMKYAYGEFRSKASRQLNNKKWFSTLQDFSLGQNEPLAELYVYAFLSDRSHSFHDYYLENLSESQFYDALLKKLETSYPDTKFTEQYSKELGGDRFVENDPQNGFQFKWYWIPIILILLFSILFNIRLYKKSKRDRSKSTSEKTETLTGQEQKILDLILENKTNKEVAESLFISVSTVKTHVNNLFKKLGVSSRDEIKSLYNR